MFHLERFVRLYFNLRDTHYANLLPSRRWTSWIYPISILPPPILHLYTRRFIKMNIPMSAPHQNQINIPRLVVTPSTPQDPPSPPTPPERGWRPRPRPTFARSRSLLEQIDATDEQKHLLAPIAPPPGSHRVAPPPARARRGSAASLVLVLLALFLVVSPTLYGPEKMTDLLGLGSAWAGEESWTSDGDAARAGAAAQDVFPSALDSTAPVFGHGHGHGHDAIDKATQYTLDPHDVESSHVEVFAHETAGPAMSHDAWKAYLRRREQVIGRAGAGPTAHLEAWDFH